MNAGSDFHVQPSHIDAYRLGTLNGACRTREGCYETISGSVDGLAPKGRYAAPNNIVVLIKQGPPLAITEFRRSFGRANNIGHQDSKEDTLARGAYSLSCQELLDLADQEILIAIPGQVVGTRNDL